MAWRGWATLVRYAEIGVKLGRARKLFEERLIRNLRCTLSQHGLWRGLVWTPGRILVLQDNREAAEHAARLAALSFGVIGSAPAWLTGNKLDEIIEAVLSVFRAELESAKSFAIRARRVETYPITSRDIARIVGAAVVDKLGLKVDLENPDVEVHIDVRKSFAIIYTREYRGVGGLPYGVEGEAYVAILEGDCEEFMAAWLVARRGARLNLVCTPGSCRAAQSFVERFVPCNDARIIESSRPLDYVALVASRLRGLPVYKRVVESKGVWLLSPLEEAPEEVLELAEKVVCSTLRPPQPPLQA